MRSHFIICLLLIAFSVVTAHTQPSTLPPPPTPAATPPPLIAEQLGRILDDAMQRPTPREQRELAYAKLLEGQRYAWSADRLRSRAGRQHSTQLAREAFVKSVELDPMLSEGYTALAEIAQYNDVDEAIRFAKLSTRVNPNNYGARRILARLYTFKSRISNGPFDPKAGQEAVAEWKHVTKLDGRNAEAWAFLSDLHDKLGDSEASIDALRRWLSSAPPLDRSVYQRMMGGQSLEPENAALKLGSALLKAGRTREAVETLSNLVADEPGNSVAVELLRDAIESSNAETAGIATQALQQAVYANPSNTSLVVLLANVQARSGRLDEAAKLIRDSAHKLASTDRAGAAKLFVELGDIMSRADRDVDSITAYENALATRGLLATDSVIGDERELAVSVFERLIQRLKAADRYDEAKGVIERSRKMLGKEDLFADRQLISLLRETGNRADALTAVKSLRQKAPNDQGFVRLEATLLTENGKVDEAVALIRKSMEARPATPPSSVIEGRPGSNSVSIAIPPADSFSNYLFISNLYTQANRGKDAIEAANQAHTIARGAERKQIARLTLATAQQMSGDFKSAEATLRELLKETPGNPIALNNLGYFLLERDERYEEAFDLIQQAVKIDPTNPSYLDSLGWAYFKLGKLPEAEKYLKEALRFDSSSGTIHEHLGDVYQKQGKSDRAKASWSRSVSLHTDPADIARV
ncbi:MAG TPA: tetratricopeptide repeat protein, partial [Pyrinomonadaceae bacterium]|nr:tetratricopeptide repeat protein [Pyrinomonadaceae bacterium]